MGGLSCDDGHFYPRSPCGERRVHYDNYNLHCVISIHALLAESDPPVRDIIQWEGIFLSTLSLRRATTHKSAKSNKAHEFLSTLSLRRATFYFEKTAIIKRFLSTLSLRRATFFARCLCWGLNISIHALLAESDGLFNGKV